MRTERLFLCAIWDVPFAHLATLRVQFGTSLSHIRHLVAQASACDIRGFASGSGGGVHRTQRGERLHDPVVIFIAQLIHVAIEHEGEAVRRGHEIGASRNLLQ